MIAGRLVETALRLAFLQEKEYPPYSKWFGTAFGRLLSAPVLGPLADGVLRATTWQEREVAFNSLGQVLVRQHNTLGLTPPQSEQATSFWGRPYRVIHGDAVALALRALFPQN